MKNSTWLSVLAGSTTMFFFAMCTPKPAENNMTMELQQPVASYGGYETQEQWGEHLVTICGCNDCHTPKKMTDHGPDIDSSLLLSGHPAQMPALDVDRKEMEKRGLAVTSDLTSWVGPWGVSYTANLTSDATGIGNWQESNFITAIRMGKYKGIESARELLPPMPWPMYKHMTDDELKAIFAYLKSTKPINNLVPEPLPPVMAMAKP